MMSVAPVASAGDAAGYYMSSDNYYFLGNLQSLWIGEGAKALGLEGDVRGDNFTAVLKGYLDNGERLGREIDGNHVHREGHDLTFSAPKSVSVLVLIGNDKGMLEAHNQAVQIAAGYVEKLVSARDTHDGITSIVPTGKMVAAAFTHDTSRNLDPQLHTHLIVANMTESKGKWKALATDYIHNAGFIETVMKMQVTLGKIYRNALRERVEALGHEVEEVGPHGMWEIKGVPEEVREEFSSRGKEIKAAVGAEATLRSRDVAAKDTRQAKVDPSRMRLMERWTRQMAEKGFDITGYMGTAAERATTLNSVNREPGRDERSEISSAVMMAVSHLSDSKTRFTWGELLLATTEFSDRLPDAEELKSSINTALKEGIIIPLDSEKGVFTSRIHLLDELSIQALSKEHSESGRVVSFSRTAPAAPESLRNIESDALVLINAPAGVSGIRELTQILAESNKDRGREVMVLASSAERATSLSKSDVLKDKLIGRSQILSGDFSLKPQSTLIIEGAERLGLKETLVLLGEAREKDAQLIFLDSAGRQANGNAMSVLESAGVNRTRYNVQTTGLETTVNSIADKRTRYDALASRYAELSGSQETVTAVVVGQREQKHLTSLIRDALQNSGQLERDGVTVEARVPVWLDSKTRRMTGSFKSGQVLEDRSDKKETRHFVIDRVHEDTRVLSLIDQDGVLVRQKLNELTSDWRLFNREEINISAGEKLIAVAADKSAGFKAKDRLTVSAVSDSGLTVEHKGKFIDIKAGQPLYVTHGYVAAPGGRDNETGVVLAALNSRDITAQTINSLAQSGDRAEVFTAETTDRAEARLQRMQSSTSPIQLVRRLSGRDDMNDAVATLQDGVKSAAGLALARAIGDQREVSFSELKLTEAASGYHNNTLEIQAEINKEIKEGGLLAVNVNGETRLIARETWEMEKAIIRTIEDGKNTQTPLMERVDDRLLDGLTDGQKTATREVLGTTDQFIGVQGYAGVGKTTQVKAVKAAIETIPAEGRVELQGLAPTHQAVKEMSDVGLVSQTIKSFIVEHDQRVSAGEKPDYQGRMFLIDESSMSGNQDTAALLQAIQDGGGRAVIMGDKDQFEAVDSGAPFRLVQERSPLDVVIMKEIVRQRDLQLKSAVHDIIDNRVDAALSRILSVSPEKVARNADAVSPLSSVQETETPVADIASDWLGRTKEVRAQTLIITQLNSDRQAVNTAIREGLAANKELGKKAVTVPILQNIKHTRHEFNKTQAWEAGMVVKRGDSYQEVIAVDRNGELISVINEDGRLALISPKELITGDVELFRKSEIEVRAGDVLRFTATARDRGQAGNEKFSVSEVKDNGEVIMQGERGEKVIQPNAVRSEQHIDYGWAVTGYGAQGTSRDYVISLEGTQEGRRGLATLRAFYITASRAKEHVQIYSDGVGKWLDAVKSPDREIKTAHDALKPETQRQQAKVIWAMGQPAGRTAIGRTWIKHQGLPADTLNVKIIPATRRHPEPAAAIRLFDQNGKNAGLALVSLIASSNGRLTQGETRMVATEGVQGAILQRSSSGETHVARSLEDALDAVRRHPKDGVVWQTGEVRPSASLLKLTRGTVIPNEEKVAAGIAGLETEIRIPDLTVKADNLDERIQASLAHERSEAAALQDAIAQINPEKRSEETKEAAIPDALLRLPEEQQPYVPKISNEKSELATITDKIRIDPEGALVNTDELRAVRKAGMGMDNLTVTGEHQVNDRQVAARIAGDLAERDAVERARTMPEREQGRMPEHDEQTHTRNIQKER
ncbi:TPA: conjugative transfer relaxase/helicase TraI [Enterobacter hormaechei subsp. xiangfangensis]|nr:conjugative transfer relaxase/helicase TraI [Enterobacter roggenkampii]MCM7653712.1 conjugative transfer relaxase/helicase TraI [Enterobacter hormaechei]HCM9429379.1 conjugative transfer relaxase/helicase TraI [Enterobacter hormaechei subsp. xiangfangensis]